MEILERLVGDVVKKGQLFTVSAPSGAGKTSLVRQLVERIPDLQVSVSHTTRKIRNGEVDSRDYFFINKAHFEKMIANDEFLEYARVFDNYYGTSKQTVEDTLSKGVDVLLEIDWQGASQIKKNLPAALSIFILPPSRKALINRLEGRGQDSEEIIARRTEEAVKEMRQFDAADYLIINDNFEVALEELMSLVIASRLTLKRQQINHNDLIRSLIS